MANIRTIAVLIAIIIFTILLSHGPNFGNSKVTNMGKCVDTPDPLHIVQYNGSVYRRIRQKSPVFTVNIPIHLVPTIPNGKLLVEEQWREAHVPWFTGILDGKYVNWDPTTGVNDLLFVESIAKSKANLGFKEFDIYLKPHTGGQYVLPAFIQAFCESDFPIGKIVISPDKNGDVFPPLLFDVSRLYNWQDGEGGKNARPPDLPYHLMSYDTEGTPTWNMTLTAGWPKAELTVRGPSLKTTKQYEAIFLSWSSFKFILLIDKDPSNSSPKIGYKYTYQQGDFIPMDPVGMPVDGPTHPNLQMETFTLTGINAWGWWNPECKPAIYLYPERETNVHVTVKPAGDLIYSDPLYPASGWQVIADKDGIIKSNNKKYPYLYYESRILDSAIERPGEGYVVLYNDLPELYNELLPKLGLTQKETQDFKDYWDKILPKSRYYFVGIMSKSAINKIEPLTISPKEDTIIRVRLYFEALAEAKKVPEPIIIRQERKGFTVVEWGGLVKTDKDHPFTCSQ